MGTLLLLFFFFWGGGGETNELFEQIKQYISDENKYHVSRCKPPSPNHSQYASGNACMRACKQTDSQQPKLMPA